MLALKFHLQTNINVKLQELKITNLKQQSFRANAKGVSVVSTFAFQLGKPVAQIAAIADTDTKPG